MSDEQQNTAPTEPGVSSEGVSDETRATIRDIIAKGRGEEGGDSSTSQTPMSGEAEKPSEKAKPAAESPQAGAEPADDKVTPDQLFARAKAIEDAQRAERDQWKSELKLANELKPLLSSFESDPVGALDAIIRKALGDDADDKRVSELTSTLYENLTTRVLGLESNSPESKALRKAAQLERSIAELKQEKAAEQRQREAQAREAEATEQRTQAVQNFSQILSDAGGADKFPWLMASEDPGGIVYDYAKQLMDAGKDVTIEDAATQLNTYIQTKISQQAEAFGHLLAPKGSAQTKQEPAAEQRSTTRSVTLTNEAASEVPNTAPPQRYEYDGDDEKHAEHTRAVLRQVLAKAKAADD